MKRAKLTETVRGRVLAWLLLAVSALGLLASAAGIYGAWELELYSQVDITNLKREHLSDICVSAGYDVARCAVEGDIGRAEALAARKNAEFRLLDGDGAEIWRSAGFDALEGSDLRASRIFRVTERSYGTFYGLDNPGTVHGPTTTPEPTTTPGPTEVPVPDPAPVSAQPDPPAETKAAEETDYIVEAAVDPALPIRDEYFWTALGLDLLWALRYWIYVLGALALALGLACFIFLLCAAGHRAEREGLTPGYFTRVPFDLMTAFAAACCAGIVGLAVETVDNGHPLIAIPVCCFAAVALALSFTLWCTALALRIKLGRWWENTVVFRLLRLLWRGVRALFRGLWALLRGLPLVWRTALLVLAACFLELVMYVGLRVNTDTYLLLWFLEKLLLGLLTIWIALNLRRLQRGGAALAAGDLKYQTDTRMLFWDFRRHGENLNAVAAGMEAAVARQMKSERMKTELITNVSHDIKTPLTSIINYVDLLKTASDPAQREEYMAVLDRQARRLKKLTEDLIEVSKASTGNVEVHLSRGSICELLRQAAGEYGERLEAAGLETVLTLPAAELFAETDGRLMWRVLDNLLSNVCKYAQSGTRFYIDASAEGGEAVLRFRNVSREKLNVSAEELTGRFVRGDRARTGEGSGLGLSIARSLTELQGGTFTLSVDGDLFKAELRFPAL